MSSKSTILLDNMTTAKFGHAHLHTHPDGDCQPRFGICFDVDGVIARGTLAIPAAVRAIKHLQDKRGDVKVPIIFVTNSLNKNQDKANMLSYMLDIPLTLKHMLQAQCPLEIFKDLHDKHCLIIGQGPITEMAQEAGFTNTCTIEEVSAAYPLLDMVDHNNRRRVAKIGYTENKNFPPVEAVILMGEPKRWETPLQLIVDLLQTHGKPDHLPDELPGKHIPVVACNMDLQFMDRAVMPRYGHGAFLLCLEALYKKVTGYELEYASVVGKPSEITFRFAEHCLAREAKRLGINQPLKRMYMIGDAPEVDIVGANLYQKYINRLQERRAKPKSEEVMHGKDQELYDPDLPAWRNIPSSSKAIFHNSTIEEVLSVLVCTGVYKPGRSGGEGEDQDYRLHGHRDFPYQHELHAPTATVEDVDEAMQYILNREQITFKF